MLTAATPLIGPAFLAGLLTFLAPCTLPLLPAYIGVISGLPPYQLKEGGPAVRRVVLWNGLLFVLGFSLVFVVLGLLAGKFGELVLFEKIWLTRLAGVFSIGSGLVVMGAIQVRPLDQTWRPDVSGLRPPSASLNAFVVGLAFGTGWTPCIGPIVASLLLLASTTGTAGQGALLLIVFSLGQAIPFLLLALGWGWAVRWLASFKPYLEYVSLVSGLLLIGVGLMLVFNQVGLLANIVSPLINHISYQPLYNKL